MYCPAQTVPEERIGAGAQKTVERNGSQHRVHLHQFLSKIFEIELVGRLLVSYTRPHPGFWIATMPVALATATQFGQPHLVGQWRQHAS